MASTPEMSTRQLLRALWAKPRACAEEPELFFAPEGERPAAREMRERSAAVLCADCPVQALCLEYAMRNREEHGIWAGYTAEEIAVLAEDLGQVA